MTYRPSIISNRDFPELVLWDTGSNQHIRIPLTRQKLWSLIKQAHEAHAQMSDTIDRGDQLGADS